MDGVGKGISQGIGVISILRPFDWIFFNVFPDFCKFRFTAHHMVVKGRLKYGVPQLTSHHGFQGAHHRGKRRAGCPHPAVFHLFEGEQQMNVVGHDHIMCKVNPRICLRNPLDVVRDKRAYVS